MWLTLLVIFLGLFYLVLKRHYSYWKNRNVPGPDPIFLLGNFEAALIGRKSLNDLFDDIYRQYDGYPFVGIFRTLSPTLVIRDPEFIKNVMTRDFKHFADNDFHVDKDENRILGRNPVVLKGQEWKTKRQQLTACFTSGKIKGMYPMLEEVSREMVTYIEKKIAQGTPLLEARELCVRYTLDNAAACAFGLEGQCFKEEYPTFRKLADDFLSPGSWNSIKMMLSAMCPAINNFMKIRFVDRSIEDQLILMVRETLEHRRKNNIVRNDFLDSAAQLYKTSNHFEDELDIVAQAASFFTDGYETSSRTMSFVIFELAAHPECQRKLREEINKYCENTNGQLTYEAVQEMPYLDACINESLRKNTITGQFFKMCTEKYTYTCTDPKFKNLTVTVEPNTRIIIPIANLQNDGNYFESPQEYKPERFFNKSEINKYCFLPFGEGQRACLGMRFALTQKKLGIAQIIKNFELSVNSKTQLPLKFDKWYFMLSPIGGLWVDFKKIET